MTGWVDENAIAASPAATANAANAPGSQQQQQQQSCRAELAGSARGLRRARAAHDAALVATPHVAHVGAHHVVLMCAARRVQRSGGARMLAAASA